MRTKALLFSLWAYFLPCWHVNGQTTWYVSNRLDGVEVDFVSLGDAYNAAAPGDTIVIYPSPTNYGGLTISKPVHLVGIGFRVDIAQQPTLEIRTFAHSASCNGIGFIAGSSGGSITSLNCGHVGLNAVENVVIDRCEMVGISLQSSANNIIRRSFIHSVLFGNGVGYRNIRLLSSSNNVIENCILNNNNGASYNIHGDNASINNLFRGNIITQVIYVLNSLFYNNISTVSHSQIGGNLNDIYNNVFMQGAPGTDPNNNIHGATDVFVGYPTQGSYSFDSMWQLTPNSPARDAGINGEDCGIFGGDLPYKLSGIHSRPLIYELIAPTVVPDGQDMNITVKIRAEQ